jgi:hypothetical protein
MSSQPISDNSDDDFELEWLLCLCAALQASRGTPRRDDELRIEDSTLQSSEYCRHSPSVFVAS